MVCTTAAQQLMLRWLHCRLGKLLNVRAVYLLTVKGEHFGALHKAQA